MDSNEVIIPKVWRSELPRVLIFLCLSFASIVLSRMFPGSVIQGELVRVGDVVVVLGLPLFWLMPAVALGNVFIRMYNVRYCIDKKGIEIRVGIISLIQSIVRIRFEDIRSIETEQTLWERILDIGTLEIGTAASGGVEIIFQGIASPVKVQQMVREERDRGQKLLSDSEKEFLDAEDRKVA